MSADVEANVDAVVRTKCYELLVSGHVRSQEARTCACVCVCIWTIMKADSVTLVLTNYLLLTSL